MLGLAAYYYLYTSFFLTDTLILVSLNCIADVLWTDELFLLAYVVNEFTLFLLCRPRKLQKYDYPVGYNTSHNCLTS